MVVAAPALAELREVCQPQAKLASRNGEHWAGRLYMRRLSLRATRHLVRTSVSPNTLTWLMVVCGVGAGAALLIPGLAGAALAAVLFQGFLFFDCVDGEVARWTRRFSTAGVYVDRLGAYLADAALMIGAGVRAARGGSELWVSVGLAAALGVVLLKASTDLVDVARARSGLAPADEESTQPRSQGIATARRLGSILKIHRVTNGIEASLVLLAAAVADAVVGSTDPTQGTVAAIAVITWGMVVAHLASILSSSRLR
ncbi:MULTISPECIES: CDP-alcohol phosphatidyltransferase family protein [unclassified Streptomyces]|uniref:CDP-alcohol phosphatidyltransferase family protein n=1 Tax=Streptomycetaceae TaxID=2062 RepID=UPI002E79833B|nr:MULTISPECIES: CDP-alcohol phosphatidyltransferase family protein [unclassified Streptomyces]MED7954700.1 CDP-alcohol phosphatidyltransferase family protein [Streptomyces sp. BE303]MEE1827497.1 CDP-alcohol phosphatidyltransferase family protein [Streptomyces sp. BE20]